MREQLRREGLSNEAGLFRSFALVREVAQRAIGQRHDDDRSRWWWFFCSMAVWLRWQREKARHRRPRSAATTAALAGVPVFIITVNDLNPTARTGRDGLDHRMMGLTVGLMTHEQDSAARRCGRTSCHVT